MFGLDGDLRILWTGRYRGAVSKAGGRSYSWDVTLYVILWLALSPRRRYARGARRRYILSARRRYALSARRRYAPSPRRLLVLSPNQLHALALTAYSP